jgi:hypothetical protein
MQTDLHKAFGNKITAATMTETLGRREAEGLADQCVVQTAGWPATVWSSTSRANEERAVDRDVGDAWIAEDGAKDRDEQAGDERLGDELFADDVALYRTDLWLDPEAYCAVCGTPPCIGNVPDVPMG